MCLRFTLVVIQLRHVAQEHVRLLHELTERLEQQQRLQREEAEHEQQLLCDEAEQFELWARDGIDGSGPPSPTPEQQPHEEEQESSDSEEYDQPRTYGAYEIAKLRTQVQNAQVLVELMKANPDEHAKAEEELRKCEDTLREALAAQE